MFTLSFAAFVLGKATLLLVSVALVDLWLRKSASAALRHRCWGTALLALLVLPVFSLTMPAWNLAVLPTSWLESEATSVLEPQQSTMPKTAIPSEEQTYQEFSVAPLPTQDSFRDDLGRSEAIIGSPSLNTSIQTFEPAKVDEPVSSWQPPAISGRLLLVLGWIAGGMLAVAPLVLGLFQNCCTRARSREITEATTMREFNEICDKLRISRKVDLIEAAQSVVPRTWGILRPVVVLPAEWRNWSPVNRRLVLLHELAHVKRFDVFYQTVARLACAVFWCHPLAWYALRRLRIERELACDDCVLMSGEKPSNYARQLLDIARQFQTRVSPPAVAMAQRTGLESRIRALLDRARSHVPISPRLARMLFASSLMGVSLLAAINLEASADSESFSSSANPSAESETVTVTGRVLDEDGSPVAGARVEAVRKYLASVSWLRSFESLASAVTDANGRYSVEIPRRAARFTDGRNFEKASTLLVATKPGMGPGQATVDFLGKDLELTLLPATKKIEGKLVDLEGAPVVGASIKVHSIATPLVPIDNWLKEAANNPSNYSMALRAQVNNSQRQIAFYPAAYPEIEANQSLGFADVVTDSQGRFELAGIGDNCKATLRIDGENISSTYIEVVAADFDSVPMAVDNPMYRSGKVFGRRFTYATSPAQVIQGKLLDRNSGEPLVGATISLYQFADNLLGIDGFLSTKTEADGTYRLTGVPKAAKNSRGIKLEVLPALDQPYFRSQHLVPKNSGLAPIDFDIQLTKAIWVEGKVTDSESLEPVTASVAYYPELSNEYAEGHEAFQKGLNTMGYGDGYFTDEQGNFRIPALPGRGAIRVVAQKYVEFTSEEGRLRNRTKSKPGSLYHIYQPGNALARVDISVEEESPFIEVMLERLPHAAVMIANQDEPYYLGGQYPVGGPTLTGSGVRFWDPEPCDAPSFNVVLGSEKQRNRPLVVFLPESERGLVLEALDDLDPTKVNRLDLKPAAKIVGKLEGNEGQRLIVGHGEIREISYASIGKDGKIANSAPQKMLEHSFRIDSEIAADGSFSLTIPATRRLSMFLTGGKAQPILLDQIAVAPGETIDLGRLNTAALIEQEQELQATKPKEERPGLRTGRAQSPKRSIPFNRVAPKTRLMATSVQAKSSTKKETSTSKTPAESKLHYRGKVVDPEGKPVANAKLQFVFWENGRLPSSNLKPLASTNDLGEFDFEIKKSDYENVEGEVWKYMRLFAFKPGYGVAGKQAASFLGTASESGEVIQLVADDQPIVGRVISVDGQPVAGAEVLVTEIWSPKNKSLRAWSEAAKQPRADYFSLRTTIGMITNGFQLPSLVPIVRTDDDGRFILRGIGREKVVELMIRGSEIEASEVKARTGDGEVVTVPYQYSQNNSRMSRGIPDAVYHPRTFTFVAPPSKPLIGKMKDEETGEPIAGALIAAGRQTTFSGGRSAFIQTRTDANGEFRLEGLPIDQRVVFCVPPAGSRYLPLAEPIDLRVEDANSRIEIAARKMPLIKGRAIDRRTGLPVLGAVQYAALSQNPEIKKNSGFARSQVHEVRTRRDGTFAIAALPGKGKLSFLALNHGDYERAAKSVRVGTSLASPGDQAGSYRTVPSWMLAANVNHLQDVEVSASDDLDVEIELRSGVEVGVGVVDANGKKVTDFVFLPNDSGSGWRKARDGKALIQGYFPSKPKRILVHHRETNTAAECVLSGQVSENFSVELKPAASLIGRILGQDGLPVVNGKLYGPDLVTNNFGDPEYALVTDSNGAFEIRGLIPGKKYSLYVIGNDGFSRTVFKDRVFEKAELVEGKEIQLE